MIYLLDTNVCVAILSGLPANVRQQFKRCHRLGHAMATSSVVEFELWFGVSKSRRHSENTRQLEDFLAQIGQTIPFERDDARTAGHLRQTLEARGKPIGSYDLLIAAQALRRGYTVVTANTREFSRVDDLAWENWAVE
jgi:tRNA(fMet)-specific endonuclease VapC